MYAGNWDCTSYQRKELVDVVHSFLISSSVTIAPKNASLRKEVVHIENSMSIFPIDRMMTTSSIFFLAKERERKEKDEREQF